MRSFPTDSDKLIVEKRYWDHILALIMKTLAAESRLISKSTGYAAIQTYSREEILGSYSCAYHELNHENLGRGNSLNLQIDWLWLRCNQSFCDISHILSFYYLSSRLRPFALTVIPKTDSTDPKDVFNMGDADIDRVCTKKERKMHPSSPTRSSPSQRRPTVAYRVTRRLSQPTGC